MAGSTEPITPRFSTILIVSKVCAPNARINAVDTPNLTAKTFETLYTKKNKEYWFYIIFDFNL